MTRSASKDDKTDQAALFGAALAAILTLTLPSGPWAPLGSVFGLVLLAVVGGYYRPLPPTGWLDALAKGAAFAAVTALASFILIAWPVQRLVVQRRNPYRDGATTYSETFLKICPKLGLRLPDEPTPADVYDNKQAYENCLGDVTSSYIGWIWTIFFALLFAGWWFITRSARHANGEYKSITQWTVYIRVWRWVEESRRARVASGNRPAPADTERTAATTADADHEQ
jgi:hypothetical protein